MDDNVVVVRFPEASKAYQALSEINRLGDEGKLDVSSAILLERSRDGKVSIPEGADNAAGYLLASGGLIGMLVGVLGGPIGMLLGGAMGAMAGGTAEIANESDQDWAIEAISKGIEPGSTALVAEVTEDIPEVLDQAMDTLEGSVTRRPTSDVYAEVQAAQDAQEKANLDELKAKLAKDRADRKAKWEAFKAKLSGN